MGFKSVRRVEIKAETTTPGEVRTTTDLTGARISTHRGRRTLPKLEFTIDEDGALLHGPQRGTYPYYQPYQPPSNTLQNVASPTNQGLSYTSTSMEEEKNVPRLQLPMKECILNDTRATTLAIKFDGNIQKFVCGSSVERFSGHTGVCQVLGSKKYPIMPHNLKLGDLLRIGSVGLVVCEINRSESPETEQVLTEKEYEYLKDNYLSLPLQSTFHAYDQEQEEEELDEEEKQQLRAMETSDEGDSEEDGRKKTEEGHRVVMTDKLNATPIPKHEDGEHESPKQICYICYEGDDDMENNPLVAPCRCKGDTKYVHLDCLHRWNRNLDSDGNNANQKVCVITNPDGLDVCTICKSSYMTTVKREDGRVISLAAKKLPPPYVTFAVVTQHETRNRSAALTNTRFQLSFANLPKNENSCLTIGRSPSNHMTLRYRTVSQVHAKIRFVDGQFSLIDASSSNGTMLFLSKPMPLEWNKTTHVKIGRTILTLRSKKRWKWSVGSDIEEMMEGTRNSSPTLPTPSLVDNSNVPISDPSAELLFPPFIESLRERPPMNLHQRAASMGITLPLHPHSSRRSSTALLQRDVPTLYEDRLSLPTESGPFSTGITSRANCRQMLESILASNVNQNRLRQDGHQRREHVLYDPVDMLAQLSVDDQLSPTTRARGQTATDLLVRPSRPAVRRRTNSAMD